MNTYAKKYIAIMVAVGASAVNFAVAVQVIPANPNGPVQVTCQVKAVTDDYSMAFSAKVLVDAGTHNIIATDYSFVGNPNALSPGGPLLGSIDPVANTGGLATTDGQFGFKKPGPAGLVYLTQIVGGKRVIVPTNRYFFSCQ